MNSSMSRIAIPNGHQTFRLILPETMVVQVQSPGLRASTKTFSDGDYSSLESDCDFNSETDPSSSDSPYNRHAIGQRTVGVLELS